MSTRDTVQAFAVDILGSVMILGGFVWAGFDASQHAGRVAMSTLIAALVLASAGGVLISKHRMAELFDFLFTQAGRARGLQVPTAGSGDDAK